MRRVPGEPDIGGSLLDADGGKRVGRAVASGLQHCQAPREFTAFHAGPGWGRCLPHSGPGEISKLALLVDQGWGQEPLRPQTHPTVPTQQGLERQRNRESGQSIIGLPRFLGVPIVCGVHWRFREEDDLAGPFAIPVAAAGVGRRFRNGSLRGWIQVLRVDHPGSCYSPIRQASLLIGESRSHYSLSG